METDHPQPVDPLVARLRGLEKSINDVKQKRGEELVRIVDASSHLSEDQRNEARRIVTDKKLDDAATAATVGVLLAQGDEEEAVKLLEPAAEKGDAMAATTLGLILEQRGEVDRALEMQRLAAAKGDHMALYNLGRMLHERGDDSSAIESLRGSHDPRAAQLIEQITA